jgi:hypothetical protein
MNKLSVADHAMFRGFADRIMKRDEDSSDDEIAIAHGLTRGTPLLNDSRTGPRKEARPPRAGYARPDASRTLTDHVHKTGT